MEKTITYTVKIKPNPVNAEFACDWPELSNTTDFIEAINDLYNYFDLKVDDLGTFEDIDTAAGYLILFLKNENGLGYTDLGGVYWDVEVDDNDNNSNDGESNNGNKYINDDDNDNPYKDDDPYEDDDSYEYSMEFYEGEFNSKLAACPKCLRVYDITNLPSSFSGCVRHADVEQVSSVSFNSVPIDNTESLPDIYCCEKSLKEQLKVWTRKNKKGR